MQYSLGILIHIAAAFAALSAGAQGLRVSFDAHPTGAIPVAGYRHVRQQPLSPERPAGIRREPPYQNAPLYARVTLGDRPGHVVTFALDEDDAEARCYVDANANGDLTDDPIPAMGRRVMPAAESAPTDSRLQYRFAVTVQGGYTDLGPAPLGLWCYVLAKKDRERDQRAPALFYYRDYYRGGTLELAGKAYRALLLDEDTDGRYDSPPDPEKQLPGDVLLIDANGSGTYERATESHVVTTPFNLNGAVWEVAEIVPSGAAVTLRRSEKRVPERLAPRGPAVGETPPEIRLTGSDGKPVTLADLRGKVVLIDFWATWCAPSIVEMPRLRKLYAAHREKGLEILGVSLDQPGHGAQAAAFSRANDLSWLHVHDADRTISRRYHVIAIPQTVLVGRDGRIRAIGLRGEALEKAVADAVKQGAP